MPQWSLLSEYFALILIVVIMLVFYDSRQVHSARRQLFWGCLRLSVASILLNSAYFLVSVLMSIAITYYIFSAAVGVRL